MSNVISSVQEIYKAQRDAVAAKALVAPVATFKAVNVDDQGVIVGVGASIAVDKQDEAVQKGALLQIAYDFCAADHRVFKANHDDTAVLNAELVSSWPGAPVLKSGVILEPGSEIPEGDSVVAINIEKGKETHWFVGVRPLDDDTRKAAREGKIVGFSWGGAAIKGAE